MKKIVLQLLGFAFLVLISTGMFTLVRAQVAYENAGIDDGYDNDVYDQRGCVWRDDITVDENGVQQIQYHDEEPEAPPEFYIEGQNAGYPCNDNGSTSWSDLETAGESALWPPLCFDPQNRYNLDGFWIGTTGSSKFNKNYDSWDELYYVVTGAANKREDPPDVDILYSSNSPALNDTLVASAFTSRYRSPIEKIFYGWSMQRKDEPDRIDVPDDEGFISQQGIVAGGEEITTTDDFIEQATGLNVNSPACRRVTRVPIVDEDNDGMDDVWEARFSTINDPTPADSPGAFYLDPTDDLDADGVDDADLNVYIEENFDAERFEDPFLGIRVTPDTTDPFSRTADGIFTNLEEYIWGTNPRVADTDDDGYGDETDILGLGQFQFKDVVDIDRRQDNEDRKKYRVTTVGISNFLEETNTGRTKVFVDSDERELFAGLGSFLSSDISIVNDAPVPTLASDPVPIPGSDINGSSRLINNNEILVEAQSFGTSTDRSALEYAWYLELRDFDSSTLQEAIQIKPTPNAPDFETEEGRLGKYQLRYPLFDLVDLYFSETGSGDAETFITAPGSLIYITVEITNLQTGEFSSKRIPIPVGSDDDLAITITDLDTGAPTTIEDYVSSYCLNGESINPDIDTRFCLDAAAGSLGDQLAWIVFEGSKITIEVDSPNVQNDEIAFMWWINDQLVTESFVDSSDNKLEFFPSRDTITYNIKVRGFTTGRRPTEVYKNQVEFQVVGPIVALESDNENPIEGEQITMTGNLVNFPDSSVTDYAWQVTPPDPNDPVITSSGLGSQFTFDTSSGPGAYTVRLDLSFEAQNAAGDPFTRTITRERTIVVGTNDQALQSASRFLANIAEAVRQNANVYYRYVLVGIGAVLLVIYSLGLHNRKSKGDES